MANFHLGTSVIGIKNRSFSSFFLWITFIISLFLPIAVAYIYITFFYNVPPHECDQLFWQSIIGNSFLFPFAFFSAIFKYSVSVWVILGVGFCLLSFSWFNKFQYLRFSDQSGIVIYSFVFISILTFISFLNNIEMYGRNMVRQQLMNQDYHKNMLRNNLDSIATASQSMGIILDEYNINNIMNSSVFSDSTLYDSIPDGPIGLFSPDSKMFLFENCKKSIIIEISRQKSNGLSEIKAIPVEVIMPIAFEKLIENTLWQSPKDHLIYYVNNIGLHYLFSWLWWVYYIMLISPICIFFISVLWHPFIPHKK